MGSILIPGKCHWLPGNSPPSKYNKMLLEIEEWTLPLAYLVPNLTSMFTFSLIMKL